MHLHSTPFKKILSGKKRVEVRINDEKRQQIKVGDQITFVSRDDQSSKILVEVTQILKTKSFFEIFRVLNVGETEENLLQKETAMHEYYSREEEIKYGVIGISFHVLEV